MKTTKKNEILNLFGDLDYDGRRSFWKSFDSDDWSGSDWDIATLDSLEHLSVEAARARVSASVLKHQSQNQNEL